MAKIGRIIGGILAIVGGALTTYAVTILIPYLETYPNAIVTLAMTLCFGILGIIGGILLLLDKTVGGILAIIAGAMLIIGFWIHLDPMVTLTINWATQVAGIGFYIDPLLAIIGGIIGLVVGKKA
ncbi:MAG: hypothetical protein LUQ65_09080 [Candidatus Helarchaeota archaeon]|nr:hypothetical protein [Candidatus Helarchaeota archaeon]